MDAKRTPEELGEMEGGLGDLKQVVTEGFEGHARGGADLKFVSREEQQRRKEAGVKEVDKNFSEYVKAHLELIAGRKKLFDIWLGNIQTNTSPPGYLQEHVARSVIHNNPGKPQAVYEKTTEKEFLVCFVDKGGYLYKVNMDFTQIPGAQESIVQLGHPIHFLTQQFQKMGCAYEQIGPVTSFSGDHRVGLQKMFDDLSTVK